MKENQGKYFGWELLQQIRERFYYLEEDPEEGQRLFFENSGGSLRLKACVAAKDEIEKIPNCPERIQERSQGLLDIIAAGTDDILKVIFGAKSGALVSELSASQAMYQVVGAIMENIPGDNVVTTAIEHPSAYDAVAYYCQKTGKELRVARANHQTGGVDVDEVTSLVDENTCMISVMAASNISGTIMDIKAIVAAARAIKPDLYVVCDAVQHAPHGIIDVEELKVDAINFAPYKFFGIRGCGYAYVSDRVARLPHHKLLGKDEDVWGLGTPTPGNYAAVSEIVNYVCWIGSHYSDSQDRRTLYVAGMERIHLQERVLLYRLLEGTAEVPGLRHIPKVEVYVDTEDLTMRDLIVAMGIKGIDYTDVVLEYQKRGVTTFERVNTSMYSKRIVEAIGIAGAVRVSPLHCHSYEEIDRYLSITKEIAETFGK